MSRYTLVQNEYEKQTGFKNPRDIFQSPNGNTVSIYEGYIVSTDRLVTTSFEGYSIMSLGSFVGIHIKVWKNRELNQILFVPISTLIRARDVCEHDVSPHPWSNKGSHLEILKTDNTVKFGEFRMDDETEKRYDEWYVELTLDEFNYILSKFEYLENYVPLKEE